MDGKIYGEMNDRENKEIVNKKMILDRSARQYEEDVFFIKNKMIRNLWTSKSLKWGK